MLRFECWVWLVALVAACGDSSTSQKENDSHPIPLPDPVCDAAASGSEEVSEPVLSTTLPASWDENWLGAAAVFDLDADGQQEIIAGRHSVLYVWSADGALLWRAPVGEDASSPNDHGESRQYASPVVGDLDGDGMGEIAIAFDTRVAVYDHEGMMLDGWPASFALRSGSDTFCNCPNGSMLD
jgi:hypothetical protein